jgi:hypothetical protein
VSLGALNIPHPEFKNVLALMGENKFEEAGDVILKHDIAGNDAESALWHIFKELLKSGKDIRTLKKYIDHIVDYGGRYSDLKGKFIEFYKKKPDEQSLEKINHVLNEDYSEKSLQYFLDKTINSTGDEKEKYKTGLFCSFHLLGDNPLVSEYRRKLSSALY